jgi:hypothetical protein
MAATMSQALRNELARNSQSILQYRNRTGARQAEAKRDDPSSFADKRSG